MNETNPYSSPQTDVSVNHAISGKFKELDFKQLKKLYHRSCNVNVITFLIGLGLITLAVITILPDTEYESFMRFIFIGLMVFYAAAVIGLYKRTSWGRILGIIACILSLINVPLGTLIGVFGLFAFFGAPELFGANRINKEVKTEFKLQKANMKKG